MRDYILLIMALVLFIPVFIIGHAIHLYKNARQGSFSMRNYAFNIAYHLDKAGGAMLFNSSGHTISAMVFEKDLRLAIRLIDWMFRDNSHCFKAWRDEFNK